MNRIIFDFGANQGQNINYFLERADYLICVEANNQLCEKMREKYKTNIDSGSLFVENYAVSNQEFEKKVFYINKIKDGHSQLTKPKMLENYIETQVETIKASSLIKKYLNKFNSDLAHYIKIDVEYIDHIILKDILSSNINFNYISCESHTSLVLNEIIQSKLRLFKIVQGKDVKNLNYMNSNKEKINFAHHSSGPFGNDINGKWINKSSLITYFVNKGFGWKDICCTYLEEENIENELIYDNSVHNPPRLGFFFHLKRLYPEFIKSLKTILKLNKKK